MLVDTCELVGSMEHQHQYFTYTDEYDSSSSTSSYVHSNKVGSPLSEFSTASIKSSCSTASVQQLHNSPSMAITGDSLHPMDVTTGSSKSVFSDIPSHGTSDTMSYGDSGDMRCFGSSDDGGWDALNFNPGHRDSRSPEPKSEYGLCAASDLWGPPYHQYKGGPSPYHTPSYHPGLPPPVTDAQPWIYNAPLPPPPPMGLPMPVQPHHHYPQHHHQPQGVLNGPDVMVVDYSQGSHQPCTKQEPLSPTGLDSYSLNNQGPPPNKRPRKQSVEENLPGLINFHVAPPNSPPSGRGGSSHVPLYQPSSEMELQVGSGSSMKPPGSPVSRTAKAKVTVDDVRAVSLGNRRSISNKVPQERQNVISLPWAAVTKRGYHSPKVWESYKETIHQLYIVERLTLGEVKEHMERKYGFKATLKMYKTKFNCWGFGKNNTEKEARQILYMKLAREREGKRSAFSRNGKQIDLPRYLRRKGVTEKDLLNLDTTSELPPHVRCWTPPPESPVRSGSNAYPPSHGASGASGGFGVAMLSNHASISNTNPAVRRSSMPGATPENQDRLLGLIRAVIQHMHVSGWGRSTAEAWHAIGPREAPLMLLRYLHKAASLARHGNALAATRAWDAVKYHLGRYAADLSPATTVGLLFSGPLWADPAITRRVWRYLATHKMRRRNPLAQLFAFMSEMVESIGTGAAADKDADAEADPEVDDDKAMCDDAAHTDLDPSRSEADSNSIATMQQLHTMLRGVFETISLEIEAIYGAAHPLTICHWLGLAHTCQYHDENQHVQRIMTENVPQLQADIDSAFGPTSCEHWEAEVFRLTALGRLGRDAVAAELPAAEHALQEMSALADPRTRPLELTCLYLLYASHRGRAGGIGGTSLDAASVEKANHYLERYLDEQTALLGAGDVHIMDTLDEARAWYRATGDVARLAEVDGRLKHGEAMRMLAADSGVVKDSITVGGDEGAGSRGGRKRKARSGGAVVTKTPATTFPEFATCTLQFVIRLTLFDREETA